MVIKVHLLFSDFLSLVTLSPDSTTFQIPLVGSAGASLNSSWVSRDPSCKFDFLLLQDDELVRFGLLHQLPVPLPQGSEIDVSFVDQSIVFVATSSLHVVVFNPYSQLCSPSLHFALTYDPSTGAIHLIAA